MTLVESFGLVIAILFDLSRTLTELFLELAILLSLILLTLLLFKLSLMVILFLVANKGTMVANALTLVLSTLGVFGLYYGSNILNESKLIILA